MNQEYTLSIKQMMLIWFIGFTTGVPFMHLLLNIKFSTSVIVPIVNFLIMGGISGAGLFILVKKKSSKAPVEDEKKDEDGDDEDDAISDDFEEGELI